jgi:APA family basic amino acid/polyamine antiporter
MLWNELAIWLNAGIVRVSLALIFLWTFVLINIKGVKLYERTVVPLMVLMFGLGAIVIVTGLSFDKPDFVQALMVREGRSIVEIPAIFNWRTFLAGSALLFSSFIGFRFHRASRRRSQRPIPLTTRGLLE